METLGNVIGIGGVLLINISYFMLSVKRLSVDSAAYGAMNVVGAILIIFALVVDWNLSAFLMETSWLAISLYGLANACKRRIA